MLQQHQHQLNGHGCDRDCDHDYGHDCGYVACAAAAVVAADDDVDADADDVDYGDDAVAVVVEERIWVAVHDAWSP